MEADSRVTWSSDSARTSLVSLARETLAALEALRSPGIEGCIGDALFAAELRRFDSSVDIASWVVRSVEIVNAFNPGASLHRGLAGLGFVIATHSDDENALCNVDELLRSALPTLPSAGLQSGVAGVALYASLRSHAATGRRLQRAVVAALAQAAQSSRGGLVWHTPLSYARRRRMDVRAEPITEFGIVHGVAGALVGLAALAQAGQPDAAELAREGLRALWAWERSKPNGFGWIAFGPDGANGTIEFDEGIWCVGDPGVFRACWLTANAIGDGRSAERAVERLREGARRHIDGAPCGLHGRIDLCCGSSAVAQVYHRMFMDTHEPIFQDAQRRLLVECARQVAQIDRASFRFGRAGVLLALLSAPTDETSMWDTILGFGLPRRPPHGRQIRIFEEIARNDVPLTRVNKAREHNAALSKTSITNCTQENHDERPE